MSAVVVVELTISEASLLAECEQIIEQGMPVFVEVGQALMRIRDGRLYRERFGTFEEYCRSRWQLDRSYANRLIDSARVVESITAPTGAEITDDRPEPPLPAPTTERQTRELAPLLDQPEQLREVWAETVQRTNGKPTAAAIRAVRKERTEEEPARPSTVDPTADPDFQAAEFMQRFASALVAAGAVYRFPAQRVALLADPTTLDSLERHAALLGKYLAEVKSHRHLRLVKDAS